MSSAPACGGAGIVSESATTSADVAFPSGLWTLYFHDPEEKSYLLGSYKVLAVIDSWEKLWNVFHTIKDEHLLTGMYFLMKDSIPPIWEHGANTMGGMYQIKVPPTQARDAYETLCAAAILKMIPKKEKNIIKGVQISSKRGHHIIKLWNNNAKEFNNPSDIHCLTAKTGDIIYAASPTKNW